MDYMDAVNGISAHKITTAREGSCAGKQNCARKRSVRT